MLLDADGWPVPADGPDTLELVVRHAGSDGAVVATARVAKHGYVDDHGHHHATAYYPLVFTPPEPGDYRVDGVGLKAGHDLRVVDPDTLDLVQVGDPLPAVETPTGADHRGVEPICTQPAGMCPFHQVTVAEALGRPAFQGCALGLGGLRVRGDQGHRNWDLHAGDGFDALWHAGDD